MCVWHMTVSFMRIFKNVDSHRWSGALSAAVIFWLVLCAPVQADASEVGVRQIGDELSLNASIQLPLPVQLEAILRNGVPLTLVQEVRVIRKRWYWPDTEILRQTREWTLAYQALTSQWRVANQAEQTVTQLDSAKHAWQMVTDIDDWRIAQVTDLGALNEAEVEMRWSVEPQWRGGNALPGLTDQTNVSFAAEARGSMRHIIAPVRDAMSTGKPAQP